ncbi:class I lanthipeptide [Flavobacterium sp. LAR06]|uniref:class I lanthipeptide n=1 Tax=Flavobacterium sp. LAR06 TaxID=3064897 RepID=UPI0035BEF607
MKKQNPHNKLVFNKAAVTELNENQLQEINGGTSIVGGEETCTGCCCVRTLLIMI